MTHALAVDAVEDPHTPTLPGNDGAGQQPPPYAANVFPAPRRPIHTGYGDGDPLTSAGSFVGREPELRALAESVDGGTRVVCVHGIAGIGKSALLGAFLDRQRAAGASVVELDCRTVEPTERGFLHAAGGFRDARRARCGASATWRRRSW